ncbi:O-antigen polymerase [Virgibacillus sp. C22-A2]|uniref:O-antigen polymerase n=1 Tax=Virgibacillus tibetensis TaxID=3042313 RepID=A0ABU6KAL9_9BACI|nr:O-antigen polymerase [Virgibacillus sp. C22-A2]
MKPLLSLIFIITPILLLLITLYLRINVKDNYLFWLFFTIFSSLFYFIPAINYGSSGFDFIQLDSSAAGYIHDVESVIKVYLFQTLFYFMFLIGYKMLRSNKVKNTDNNVLISHVNSIVLISSVLSLLGTIGAIYFSGMSIQQLISSSRFDYWETKSTIPHLFSSYLQTTLVVSAFLFPFVKKKSLKFITLISLFALFYVEMMIFGSRSTFLAVGAAFAFGTINYMKSTNKKIKFGRVIFVGLSLLHLMVVWQYVRYNSSSFLSLSDWLFAIFNFKEAYSISLFSGDLNYFFGASVAAFNAVPSTHDFLYGSTYFRLFLFFLPSSIVLFKPEETQRIFASIINPQQYSIGATFPPSFIGDSYINFGFFGIVIGLLLGLLLKTWQIILNNPLSINKITVGSAGFLFLFLFIRGTFNGLYNMIFIWIFLIGFIFVLRVLNKKTSSKNSAILNKTPI